MLGKQELTEVIGSEAFSEAGEKIGKVGQVYVDDETSEPAWATVHTGLFGLKENFVPLQHASYDGGRLTVPYEKDKVKDAPSIDPDGHIEREEEAELYRYYGLEADTERTAAIKATGKARLRKHVT